MGGPGHVFRLRVASGEVMAYLAVITVTVPAFHLVLKGAFIASIAPTGVIG